MMSQNGDLIAVGEKQFSPYRVADYLTTPSEITAYLKAAKEANDPELLAAAIEDIRQIELYRARAKNPNPLRG
jgi:DNA-binding phage protein